jgi:hypothetical protein
MLDRQTNSIQAPDGSKLFEDAYSNLKPQINFVEEHKAETVGLVILGTLAAVLALRGRGFALGARIPGSVGTTFEIGTTPGSLGKTLIRADDGSILRAFDPKKYHTVAAEVRGFSRYLGELDFPLSVRTHDARAHVLTLKNPATVGGELRGAISESVAKQMIDGRREYPLFHEAVHRYEDTRIILRRQGLPAPKIPEPKLKQWFELSRARMDENFELWGYKPRSSLFEDLKDLPVRRKWS